MESAQTASLQGILKSVKGGKRQYVPDVIQIKIPCLQNCWDEIDISPACPVKNHRDINEITVNRQKF